MTLAEIHGKISSSGSNVTDRLEDLLTSDLFGPLRYLPFELGLRPILEGAINLQTEKNLDMGAQDAGEEYKVDFWPRLPTCEPDVLISTEDHIFLVEAKYLSGESGHYQEGQDIDDGESELVAAGSDQLYREYEDLVSLPGSQTKRSLIYLTAHRTPPIDDIEAGAKALIRLEKGQDEIERYRSSVYWLSWFKVREIVSDLLRRADQPLQQVIYQDILELLLRKGFRHYEGVDGLGVLPLATKPLFYQGRTSEYFSNIPVVPPIEGEFVFYQRGNRVLDKPVP